MGFFSKYNEIEKGLLTVYSQMFSDMGFPDAEETTENILDKVIEESKGDGLYDLPINYGDLLLKREKIDDSVRKKFEQKRKEGVTDNDIRWWFNLNDIERRMMLKMDEFHRISSFTHELESGKSEEEADKTVRKYHPVFGDLKDETHGSGDNRPLPLELKDRINIYIEKRFKNDPQQYKIDIENSSTFNALIRKEIREGNI